MFGSRLCFTRPWISALTLEVNGSYITLGLSCYCLTGHVHWFFLDSLISCSVWCVDDLSLLWKNRCFELPIILHKVKLFAQPRGCLRDLLQTTDRSMSLIWGMSRGQVCECWKQKNETTWLQHLSEGRRLWNISILLYTGYRLLEP